MGFQTDLAKLAMLAKSSISDFMSDRPLGTPKVPGAFPGMVRDLNTAAQLHMFMDLIVFWGIGDIDPTYQCSGYYNPASPWYNVFYGAYAIQSYKLDGTAWGYDAKGQADFDEFLQVPALDYNFLTATQFGCPPNKMCFAVESRKTSSSNGWDFADMTAQIPSGLHYPPNPAHLGAYIVFGIPDKSFLVGHSNYEPVQMHGQFYMRKLSVPAGSPPITFVWGATCPNTPLGNSLLQTIMQALEQSYASLT